MLHICSCRYFCVAVLSIVCLKSRRRQLFVDLLLPNSGGFHTSSSSRPPSAFPQLRLPRFPSAFLVPLSFSSAFPQLRRISSKASTEFRRENLLPSGGRLPSRISSQAADVFRRASRF
ncbi:hypothetical protein LINGRAHAP2_LOCUS8085 [Linum grandiflorum]